VMLLLKEWRSSRSKQKKREKSD